MPTDNQHENAIAIRMASDRPQEALQADKETTYKDLSKYHGNSLRMNLNVLCGVLCIGLGFVILEQGISRSSALELGLFVAGCIWLFMEWQRYKNLKAWYNKLCNALDISRNNMNDTKTSIKLVTEPAWLNNEIVAVAEDENETPFSVRWDIESKAWAKAPEIISGDILFLAVREGALTKDELIKAGIQIHR